MCIRALIHGAGLTTAALLAAPGVGAAQEAEGLLAGFTLGAGVQYDDEEWRARSDLGFTLSSTTRIQSIGLALRGALEFPDAEDEIALVDPSVTLTYSRLGKNAELEAEAAYQRSDIGTLVPDEIPTSDELLLDTGTRTTTTAGARLAFGTQAPLGGEVGLDWKRVNYSDLADTATLEDYETRGADAMLRFSINPQIDLRLLGDYEETTEQDTDDARRIWSAGVGADLDINKRLRATVDLKYTEIEERSGGTTNTESGPEVTVGLVRQMPNGTLSFELASVVTDTGTRSTARVEREQELRLGELTWSAGVTRGSEGDVDALYGLEYARPGKRGELSLSLQRAIRADAFGEESLVDQFQVGYRRKLSEQARLDTGLTYRNTDYFSAGTESVEQFDFGVSYRHQLTRDADVVARFTHSVTRRDSRDDDSENTFYLGLQRSFSWRP